MSLRMKIVLTVTVLFTLINVGGAVYAAVVEGEALHSALHVGLSIVGALVAWWITARRSDRVAVSAPYASSPSADALTDHLS